MPILTVSCKRVPFSADSEKFSTAERRDSAKFREEAKSMLGAKIIISSPPKRAMMASSLFTRSVHIFDMEVKNLSPT